jgi:N-acetylmuramoyl-L-alanine amidase
MNILDRTSKVHNNPTIEPKGLIVHTTANRKKGATALMHDAYYDNNSDRVSVQWTVDSDSAALSVPENMAAWHAGNREYNLSYIGMEICENNVVDNKLDQATYDNAVDLAADILKRHGWGVDKMIQHRDVPGREWKNCPNKDLINWDKFNKDVNDLLNWSPSEVTINAKKTTVIDEKDGSQYESFIIDGRTYAPVRSIAESAGRQVHWNGKNVILK